MSLQNMSKSAVRTGKNYIKGYSDTQVKVRDSTSNDPWGPSGTQMNELAQLSYNQNDFIEMMEIMDKRLNDKGKNWRHVFKTLTLLDYLLHAGSENVVIYFRDNMYVVKTLREFQYIDESGKDQGANVRQKAKDITNLLQDEARLRDERRGRTNMRDRMSGAPPPSNDYEDDEGRRRRRADDDRRRARQNNEEEELRKAIEESKRMAKEEQDKIRAEAKDEEELQRALKLSRDEEEKRIKELEAKTQNALFDDDWNLVSNAPNQYAQQQQPQQTGWGDPNMMYMQQQYTSYNPYFFQQQQMQAQQEAEYQRQMELQAAAAQYQQMMTQQQQVQPIQPQPTAFGSNNPFAFSQPQQQQQQPQQQQSFYQQEPQQPPQSSVPVADLLGEETTPTPTPQAEQPKPQSNGPPRVKVSNDPRHAELNRLLASGEGIDTFGNFGDMRLGHSSGRTGVASQPTGLNGQPTGSNPFHRR
ncbi:unnamed protein product [Sympodiomycopsis kandeliae]